MAICRQLVLMPNTVNNIYIMHFGSNYGMKLISSAVRVWKGIAATEIKIRRGHCSKRINAAESFGNGYQFDGTHLHPCGKC